ncbi:hypothetical protein RchiOBHm_Chr3g0475991 [Rosa chinensis]|uniref:Uncharacterized protein n=1 Tax=Rosa chinensis TaxID=74649 RepID=A0A2P6RCI8_ROSCH|nr:hypothetical protein RchiOBHm_Chr3g0475991 [Rosa chinensis]
MSVFSESSKVVITNVIGLIWGPITTEWIQVENVVCLLRPCFTFQQKLS